MAEAELREADEDEEEWQRRLKREQHDVDCVCGVSYDDGEGESRAGKGGSLQSGFCAGVEMRESGSASTLTAVADALALLSSEPILDCGSACNSAAQKWWSASTAACGPTPPAWRGMAGATGRDCLQVAA